MRADESVIFRYPLVDADEGASNMSAVLPAVTVPPFSSKSHGVRVDGTVVTDRGLTLPDGTYVVQVGKRKFRRVTVA